MLEGLLGAAKGGAEEYLDIREEDRAEERKIAGEERAAEGQAAKEERAQDIWELRQKRLDDYGIAGEKRKAATAEESEKRRSGLVEGREIGKEERKTAKEEKEAGRISSAMEESRPRTEAAPDAESESIGPPQMGGVDEEAAAGLLTQKGYPDLAKSVRESKSKSGKVSSDVSTANWMVEKGIASDEKQAWGMLKSAASDPVNSVAKMADLLYPTAKDMYPGDPGYVSPEDRMANAEREVARIRNNRLGGGERPAPGGKRGAPSKGDTVGGFTFLGGNPKDKANWEVAK